MYSLQTTSFWALLVQHCIIDDDVSRRHEREARYTQDNIVKFVRDKIVVPFVSNVSFLVHDHDRM